MTGQTTMVTPQATAEGITSTPEGVNATAEALYGASGKANGEQGQQAAEPAKAEGQQGSEKAATQEGDKPSGAPEKYEFKPVEGAMLDSEVVSAYSEAARELNLTQEAAQKMLDKVVPVMARQQSEQHLKLRTSWVEESRADKEFGGDKLDANLAIARKPLDMFGTPQLRKLLNESGLGDHPEVIRMLYRFGRAVSEDGYVGQSSGSARNAPRDYIGAASVLYPNSPT